ncbi:hypothetical protein PHYSODRAFT_284504 [Phytophthora sojae]|uniref:RxLR effector protein n=2 Tax=Phytophthora sojae TaxID=67593 RepID=G4YJD6_PHYSP|nr:hypothetical protein PHYSODRAFT_284504 [Phytophthora sojae]AEK81331.1 Avh439 [Phytophthora sojae]AEK81332.1 Avh439 [Phytophthora sojae]AEK81333.1 Avh439 [Phytophthora sojae]EGZ29733.1 hypothetical protein PHYSODRAFT_284504 [Phytophthora sojae]|eukprot:XP_009517008.1 hypothetical protein PHYSODRAFT_284504 [Phytophthora sojae]
MRFCLVVLLAALLVLTNSRTTSAASETYEGADVTTISSYTKRSLRTAEDKEERGITVEVPSLEKVSSVTGKLPAAVVKRPNKAARLFLYNLWLVVMNKSPQWVKQHHPALADGYMRFRLNRLVGKYA